jgi:signal transduction histidine kinase
MDFLLNPCSFILIFTGILVGAISIYISYKSDDSIKWMGYAMIAAAVWGFFYGIELTKTTLEEIMVCVKFEYIGLLAAPTFWLIFSLKYTGFDAKKMKWIVSSLFVIALILYLAVLTNSYHHLHYKSYWLIETGPFPLLGMEKGPWYTIQTIYAYSCFLAGTLILWRGFQNANAHFKKLTRILVMGGVFPMVLNILYQTSIFKPFEGLDLTPFSFLFSYLFLGIAIVKFRFLDIKPVARDKILELITNGVIVFDQSLKIIDFNPAAKTLFADPNVLKIGSLASLLFQDRPEILGLINEDSLQNRELTFKIQEENKFYKIESVTLKDKKGTFSGYILLFEEITKEILNNEKLQNQAEELQRLNDLKDRLFGIISHDLKGPILGVKELIHLTNTGYIPKEEFLEILPEVSKNMEHVALLLENLLGWTSSQLRGEQVDIKEIQLDTIIRSQKNLLERIAKEKEIQIELEGLQPIQVYADKNMLELIIRNLISNAIKFSPQNSKIIVTTTQHEKGITICIQDFGIGISDENLQKLNSGISFTTRGQSNESGTGLGLVLVREYIAKTGGTLEIKSKEGEGSRFCFTLKSRPGNFHELS